MVVVSNLMVMEASPVEGNLFLLPSIPIGSSSLVASEDVYSSSSMGGIAFTSPAFGNGRG